MSDEEFLLLNPGPVPVTDTVREAMAEPMVSHRSTEFEDLYARTVEGLDYVFTRSTVDGTETAADGRSLVLNGTATMGMEAALTNLAPDRVLALVNGKFGRRFARIADRYTRVETVEVGWGESFDLDEVASAITAETDVVTMVHNETSTGILNPVAEVGELAAEHGAFFVVDGVTSIGGDEFRIDDWHIDIAVTDAQKALAAPPGISALYVTERAIDAFDGDQAPFYGDLDWHIRKATDDQTPFTSAVPLFRGLAVAVEQIKLESMPARIRRHRRYAAAFRDGFEALGLSLFPDLNVDAAYSNTVTAVTLPEPVRDAPATFFDAVSARNVSISGGQAHLGGEIFRVSNMGELEPNDIVRGIRTVGVALEEAGFDAATDDGVAAAADRLG